MPTARAPAQWGARRARATPRHPPAGAAARGGAPGPPAGPAYAGLGLAPRALECGVLQRDAAVLRPPPAWLWGRLWGGRGLCSPFTAGSGLAARAPPRTAAPACRGRASMPALDA